MLVRVLLCIVRLSVMLEGRGNEREREREMNGKISDAKDVFFVEKKEVEQSLC